MKVLMFGWEFPPHISGGLGTACYGITHALLHENTQVLFVAPKLYGDEPADKVELLSASEVPVTRTLSVTDVISEETIITEREAGEWAPHRTARIEVIEVPSSLLPYQLTSQEEVAYEIEQWNYRFQKIKEAIAVPVTETVKETETITYSFTGGYGSQLIKEVYRYAEVATAIASENEFDVIHAHDWMTFPAGIAAKQITGKPLVVHVHATEHDRALNGGDPHVFTIEKEGMEAADRVVAVSQWTKELIIHRYGIVEEKITVVHNGIILSGETTPSETSPVGSQVVTFLGRITHQKGPLYFVNAAALVLKKFPDAHFLMAGSGDLFPQILERVAQLKMSSRFHFTGFLKKKEINKVLSFSSVYVMPSVSEPFGITPLEAVHAGVPVIISKQSGVAEVMEHALKVDFWDSDALANAICSILKYESLSTTLKKNSGNEIKDITWNKSARKLNTIYHDLVNSNPRTASGDLLSGSSAEETESVPLL
jgi:glycogen(starch) synthase